jgi:hypothetical protein
MKATKPGKAANVVGDGQVKSAGMHPNEFDRKRVERAVAARKRYRYVSPTVQAVAGGYLVQSPNCSRNIDPRGGIIDIALLRFHGGLLPWRLFRREFTSRAWELRGAYDGLPELLEELVSDRDREYWR